VRLRDTGQAYQYYPGDLQLKEGDYVIVEHDRGHDYGQVVSLKQLLPASGEKQPIKKILRLAHAEDLKQIEENRAKSKEAFNTCLRKLPSTSWT